MCVIPEIEMHKIRQKHGEEEEVVTAGSRQEKSLSELSQHHDVIGKDDGGKFDSLRDFLTSEPIFCY